MEQLAASSTRYAIINRMSRDERRSTEITKEIVRRVRPYLERLSDEYGHNKKTDGDLARDLGTDTSTLSLLINGKRDYIHLSVLMRLAKLTGLDFWTLVGEGPAEEDDNHDRARALAAAFLLGYSPESIRAARGHVASHGETPRTIRAWIKLVEDYEDGSMSVGVRIPPRR